MSAPFIDPCDDCVVCPCGAHYCETEDVVCGYCADDPEADA